MKIKGTFSILFNIYYMTMIEINHMYLDWHKHMLYPEYERNQSYVFFRLTSTHTGRRDEEQDDPSQSFSTYVIIWKLWKKSSIEGDNIWKPPIIGDIFYSYSSSSKEIHTFSDIGDGWNKLGPLQSRQRIDNWKYDYGGESEIRNIVGNWVLFLHVRVWVNRLAFQFNKMHIIKSVGSRTVI